PGKAPSGRGPTGDPAGDGGLDAAGISERAGTPAASRSSGDGRGRSPMSGIEIAEDIVLPDTGDGRLWVAGAVVVDDRGRAFAQRRSPDPQASPDCWAVAG